MHYAKRHTKLATTLITSIVAVGLAFLLSGCGGTPDIATERAQRAEQAQGDILIGAAWPWVNRGSWMYGDGMQMAVDEINAAGGVLGRSVQIIREDDQESVTQGRLAAQRFIDNPDVVAVIGHLNSHVSIPVASMYEEAGLLMLTPASTSPELTRQGLRRVFRCVDNDEKIGRLMQGYAESKQYRRIAIAYVRNEYGWGLANAFEWRATEAGLDVVTRKAYDPAAADRYSSFRHIIEAWEDVAFDAVFLAGMAPQAGYLIKELRAAGIDVPIFGGDALDAPELIKSAGVAAEGVVAASVFHPDDPRAEVRQFNTAFEAIYGKRPDSWAARGYEAVKLLTHAMEETGSTVPDRVAETLHGMDTWNGILGSYSFDEKGDVVGKSLVTAVVREGQFAFSEQLAFPDADAEGAPYTPSSASADPR